MSQSQTRTNQLPPEPPRPRITSSEPALMAPEFQPIYANLVREISALPPPHQGGDQGWPP